MVMVSLCKSSQRETQVRVCVLYLDSGVRSVLIQ